MKYTKKQSGFSAVELLITLFVAGVFLITGFQLYAVIIKMGGDARQQAIAADTSADYLQKYESAATSPCTNQSPLANSPITVSGLSNVTVSVAIQCPFGVSYVSNSRYSTSSYVSKVVVTIKYGTSQTILTNSSYISGQGQVTKGLVLNLDGGSTASYPGNGSTWTDLSGNGINGTLSTTGVTYSAANSGILNFDGANGYVAISPSSARIIGSITNTITVEAWINPNSIANYMFVLGNARTLTTNGFGFGTMFSSGLLRFMANNVQDYVSTTAQVTTGAWQQVLAVMKPDNSVTFYINGVQKDTINGPSPMLENTDDLLLVSGITNVGSAPIIDPFSGSIGCIYVYNRALSNNEITQNFNANRNRYGL